ncbi:MAG: ABC transporter substrate-binding protein [Brevefilum sp.]|jgi:peptide/nickel transport system substrate-binding protein
MQKRNFRVFGIVIVLAMVLAACQPVAQPTPETIVETVVEKEEVVVTEVVEVEVEVEVEAAVDRNGAWLDTVVIVADPSVESAVARILADDIDVYAQAADNVETLGTVESQGLKYASTVGSYNEMTLSPGGPILENDTLNPFGVPKIREAMNYLVSRDYIVQEILGGLGIPKFFPINGVFPDYANFVDVARELENKYAYNPELADEIVTEEMDALGAEKVNGIWHYEGEPVVLIGVIRTEDSRLQMGDYFANQLETIGFTVDRQYKTASEASPIWLLSDPQEGLWHFYTGGWITTAISRDDGDQFQFFYSPKSDYSFTPLWQNYVITDEFDAVAEKLANNQFSSIEERADLFREALYLAMECSYRIWLNDSTSYSPMNPDVTVTYDLAGGIAGTPLWGHTLRYTDKVGGQMVVAMADTLVDPWNPLAGSNWVYDMAPMRATGDYGTIPDPYTGLVWPQRIESAAITVEEGLPVGKTLDWLTLDFAPEIQVPGEAWVDWDAENQVFITADEKLAMMAEEAAAEPVAEAEEGEEGEEAEVVEIPEYFTAKRKSVVTYPADLFEKHTWHDGSPMSVADFVMYLILSLDPGTEGSEIYDASQVGKVESFKSSFKGFNITSTDPLVIEYYSDVWYLDAEYNVTSWWPYYDYGEGPWHMMALGILAETDEELAFSGDKSEALKVEWLSYISGPSLEILRENLDQALEEDYIPYAATLGKYISAEEAADRYNNLLDWYRIQGHFFINSGPFYLNKVFPVEKTLTLTRYQDYQDPSGKWDLFGTPMIADLEVDGPGRVKAGEEVVFDAYVTFEDEPYPTADLKEVNYLLFDATGALVGKGLAEMVEEGLYSVTLSADDTSALAAGSNKLEVIVVPSAVSIPTFAQIEFVTE